MSGYENQSFENTYGRTRFDGALIFTERLRQRVSFAIKGASEYDFFEPADPTLVTDLLALAQQQPFPSHQAQQLLIILAEHNLAPIGKNYDVMVSQARQADEAGFPHLAQKALAEVGIRYEFADDSCDVLTEDLTLV